MLLLVSTITYEDPRRGHQVERQPGFEPSNLMDRRPMLEARAAQCDRVVTDRTASNHPENVSRLMRADAVVRRQDYTSSRRPVPGPFETP